MSAVTVVDAVTGGAASRGAFESLCGVAGGGPGGWRVRSVQAEVRTGKIRLGVARPGEEWTVYLKPPGGDPYFIRAGTLDFSYEGKEASPALIAFLESIARRLEGRSCADLAGIVRSDPGSKDGAAMSKNDDGEAPDAQGVTDRLGGNPGQWRRFFCHREFERKFHWAHPAGFAGRILYFVHGDFDCTFMPPDVMYRGMNFINYPPIHPHSADAPVPDTAYEQWATDLRSKDIVLGTQNKTESFISSIARRAAPDDVVMVSWSCVPTIIGDDEDAMARACREAGSCPVLINSIRYRSQKKSFSLFEDLFTEIRSSEAFKAIPADPNGVNVLDVQPRFAKEELRPWLAELGIRINSHVFPVIHVPTLREYPAARAQVVPDYMTHKESVMRAIDGLPMETVVAPAPWGLKGTKGYLLALAKAFGKEEEASKLWDRAGVAALPRWEALREEAKSCRVAFVMDESVFEVALREGFVAGVPVMRAVAEMGFGVDFLVYARNGRLPDGVEKLKAMPVFAKRPPEIHSYRNPKELSDLLENGPFQAVYSDIFFDFRLTTAGKSQFSMRTFESGLAGAIRSFERMLAICRLPFYGRYKKYLKRVDRGQDV